MNDFDPLERARAQWRWRGKERPPFADVPELGQVSVWDFPRPPALVREEREIVVCWGETLLARTRGAWAVRETSHPPTFYLPLADVASAFLRPAGQGSFCEWKGPAVIGICWMVFAACHRSLGAIRSPWLELSRWLNALLFTHTISIALWTVRRLWRKQVVSTADGSRLICQGHLKVVLTVAAGKVHLSPAFSTGVVQRPNERPPPPRFPPP